MRLSNHASGSKPQSLSQGRQRVVPGPPSAALGNWLEPVRNANSQIPAGLQIRNSEGGPGICFDKTPEGIPMQAQV